MNYYFVFRQTTYLGRQWIMFLLESLKTNMTRKVGKRGRGHPLIGTQCSINKHIQGISGIWNDI